MKLSRKQIKDALVQWNDAWEKHDLNRVMQLFHDDIFFENWTGAYIKGKKELFRAWEPWFKNHGDFRFIEEETFIDEQLQKVLYRWILEWPSMEPGYERKNEVRKGADIFHFKDGKIINKLTYSKTTIEIENNRMRLVLPL
ncbi:MAG: nuclear transport factor 2 family protein [Desulfobacteraceae bacterium]|nr:MAG: nuclear transport factor 2 family protein [Desulfobacteraceae bacterium]